MIQIGNTPIKQVSTSKSLGMMIDETLTWHSHVDLITKKVNKGFHVVRRLREFADLKTLVMVYKTLIQPHFVHKYVLFVHKYGAALELHCKINYNVCKIGQCVLLQSAVMTTDQQTYLMI